MTHRCCECGSDNCSCSKTGKCLKCGHKFHGWTHGKGNHTYGKRCAVYGCRCFGDLPERHTKAAVETKKRTKVVKTQCVNCNDEYAKGYKAGRQTGFSAALYEVEKVLRTQSGTKIREIIDTARKEPWGGGLDA